jgi:putative ABC transport system permease protein
VGGQWPGDAPNAQRFAVSPDYFATLRIPVLHGRPFTANDRADAEPVVILNTTAARTLWQNENAIGKRVRIAGGEGNPFRRVVGVVGDVAPGDLGARKRAQAYLPLSQFLPGTVTGVARTTTGAPALRDVLRRIDPDVAFYGIAPLPSLVRQSEARRTFILTCLSSFSMVTLALAMIGLYGVLSLFVSSRTREIGVRMALGAQRKDVLSLVVGRGLKLALLGLALGLIAAFAATRFVSSLLYGVTATDPVTFVGVSLLLPLVAGLASWLPARRATKLDPITVLRHE